MGDYQVASEGHVSADDWRDVKSTRDTDLLVISLCSASLADTGSQKDHGFYVLAGEQCVPRDAAVLDLCSTVVLARLHAKCSLAVRRKPDFPTPAGLSVSREVAKRLPQRQRKQRGKAPLFDHGAVVPSSRRESRACFIGTRLDAV